MAIGESVPCAVEAASDADKWITTRNGVVVGTGYDPDTMNYQWTATDALGNAVDTFDSAANPSTTWTAPLEPGTYTLTCSMDDTPKPLPAGQGISRDDTATHRVRFTVQVATVEFVEDTTTPQKYGFDDFQDVNTKLAEPWKSVGVGTTDTAYAEIFPRDSRLVEGDGVNIRSSDETRMSVTPEWATNATQIINVTGVEKSDDAAIEAVPTQGDPVLARLRVAVYPVKKLRVGIVRVHLVEAPDKADDVQKIPYGQGNPAAPYTICISPGPNGHTDTARNTKPGGDDKTTSGPEAANGGAPVGQSINTGANGICETIANKTPDVIRADMEAKIKDIFKQTVVELEEVVWLDDITLDWDVNGDHILQATLADWRNPEQERIIDFIQPQLANKSLNKVVFLVANPRLNALSTTFLGGIAGLDQPYAFAFIDKLRGLRGRQADVDMGVAHELCHAYGLPNEHPTNDPKNIMYDSRLTGGKYTHLRKGQWDIIQLGDEDVQPPQ